MLGKLIVIIVSQYMYQLIFLCSLTYTMIFVIVRVAYTTPFMSLFKELGLEREIIKTRWIK